VEFGGAFLAVSVVFGAGAEILGAAGGADEGSVVFFFVFGGGGTAGSDLPVLEVAWCLLVGDGVTTFWECGHRGFFWSLGFLLDG